MPNLEKMVTNQFYLEKMGSAKLLNSKTHEITLNSESNVPFDCY